MAASSHLSHSTSTKPTEENQVESVADDDLPEYAIAVEYNSEHYKDLVAGFWITSKWPYLRPLKVLNTSKFCCSGVSRRPEFRAVRPILDGRTYGIAAVYQSTRHCPEDRHKSRKMQQPASSHDNIITAAGQSADPVYTTEQSLQ